ncbi:MAG: ATP-binding protein [Chloroflexota bacterium]
MFAIYLTPAAISYLTQFSLALLITFYLVQHNWTSKRRSTRDFLLVGFFASITLFSLLLFLEASSLPTNRLRAVYLENPVMGISLVLLTQFAYRFPTLQPRQKREALLALAFSGAYALYETSYAVWRFGLLAQGRVEYRLSFADYWLVAVVAWIPIVFFRQALQNRQQRACRNFALIFLIPIILALMNTLYAHYFIPMTVYHIGMSMGILFTIFAFVVNYLNALPETTSFLARLSGAILTSLFAVLGSVAWVIIPAYTARYAPHMPDQRTLHFSPNPGGGYDVTEAPFRFEMDLGEKLRLTDNKLYASKAMQFDFPFYGQSYRTIYITNDGALSMGEDLHFPNLQYNFGQAPAIFPVFIDLYPEISQGGLFARQESDRLIITCDRMRAFYQQNAVFTYQVVLYSSGVFEITYNGLPESLSYRPNDRPEAAVWMLGATPGNSRPDYQRVDLNQLPIQSGPQGLIQDENAAFRRYLHAYLLPLAYLILGSSLAFLIGFPYLLTVSLLQPLNALLGGVQKMNTGERPMSVPVIFNDEIGFLTHTFNRMSSEIDDLVAGLESRVAERTAELTTANAQLRILSVAVEQSPNGIVITDTEARVQYANPAFTHFTGYSFEEVRGQTLQMLNSDQTSPEIFEQLWQTLLAGETWRGEFANRRKDGEIYWEYNIIAPIYDELGQATHYLAVKEDVTKRQQMEEDLLRAKYIAEAANRAKSVFLANMSHELRTPLNAILGFTELMGHSPNLTPEQNRQLAIINRSGEHLLALINSILELSKIEAGRMELQLQPVDLYSLLLELQEMYQLRAEHKGLTLRIERSPDLPQHVRADHSKLRQVLLNLLSNAVKFTRSGGVVLRAGITSPDQNNLEGNTMLVHFAIQDTGVGIAAEELPGLFTPFTQTESGKRSQQGTGLGLAISRQYVELMGGQIAASSQLGVGSTFAFDIPVTVLDAIEEVAPDRRVVAIEPGQPSFRILIAEDVDTIRLLLSSLLQPLGFAVRQAANGQEALAIWDEWQPDLIFMDIRMPILDGYGAIKQIKSDPRGSQTVIVALTSSAFAEDRSTILAQGCNEFIRKPFRQREIFDVLHKCLGVCFVYEAELQQAVHKSEPGSLDTSLLPEAWKTRLLHAVDIGDFQLIRELIGEIEIALPTLAQELTMALNNFNYARIRALIR